MPQFMPHGAISWVSAGIRLLNELPFAFYFPRLEIAIKIIPITVTVIVGAGVSPVSPGKNIHSAIATQIIPTISLAFLTQNSLTRKTKALYSMLSHWFKPAGDRFFNTGTTASQIYESYHSLEWYKLHQVC